MHRVHLVKVGRIFFQNISKEYFCDLVRFYSYLDFFRIFADLHGVLSILRVYVSYSIERCFMCRSSERTF